MVLVCEAVAAVKLDITNLPAGKSYEHLVTLRHRIQMSLRVANPQMLSTRKDC